LTIPESVQDIGVFDVLVNPFQPSAKLASWLDFADGIAKLRGERHQLLVVIHCGDEVLEPLRAGAFLSRALLDDRLPARSFGLGQTSPFLVSAVLLLRKRSFQQAHHNMIELFFERSPLSVPYRVSAKASLDPELKFAGVLENVRSRVPKRRRLGRRFSRLPSHLALAFANEHIAVLVEDRHPNLPAVAGTHLVSPGFQRGEESLQQAERTRLCRTADVDVEVSRQRDAPTEVGSAHHSPVLARGPQ
jgi:hypothetical protein